jgi:hypothetical protein
MDCAIKNPDQTAGLNSRKIYMNTKRYQPIKLPGFHQTVTNIHVSLLHTPPSCAAVLRFLWACLVGRDASHIAGKRCRFESGQVLFTLRGDITMNATEYAFKASYDIAQTAMHNALKEGRKADAINLRHDLEWMERKAKLLGFTVTRKALA